MIFAEQIRCFRIIWITVLILSLGIYELDFVEGNLPLVISGVVVVGWYFSLKKMNSSWGWIFSGCLVSFLVLFLLFYQFIGKTYAYVRIRPAAYTAMESCFKTKLPPSFKIQRIRDYTSFWGEGALPRYYKIRVTAPDYQQLAKMRGLKRLPGQASLWMVGRLIGMRAPCACLGATSPRNWTRHLS